MPREFRYFIRESGAKYAVINGISTMSKIFANTLAFNLVLLNSLEWIPKMRTFLLFACTGRESVLAFRKHFDGKHNCADNIGAQALCEPCKLTIKMS